MAKLNQTLYYLIMVLLPLAYTYTYFKFKRAKDFDNTLKLKLNLRSKIETYLLIALSIGYIVYPVKPEAYGVAVFIGAFIFLLVYFNMERLTIVGRKVIFTKFLAFEVKAINKRYYAKGRFEFYLRGGKVKVLLPVADMDYVMETLSGSTRRNRRNK